MPSHLPNTTTNTTAKRLPPSGPRGPGPAPAPERQEEPARRVRARPARASSVLARRPRPSPSPARAPSSPARPPPSPSVLNRAPVALTHARPRARVPPFSSAELQGAWGARGPQPHLPALRSQRPGETPPPATRAALRTSRSLASLSACSPRRARPRRRRRSGEPRSAAARRRDGPRSQRPWCVTSAGHGLRSDSNPRRAPPQAAAQAPPPACHSKLPRPTLR